MYWNMGKEKDYRRVWTKQLELFKIKSHKKWSNLIFKLICRLHRKKINKPEDRFEKILQYRETKRLKEKKVYRK